MSLLVIVPTRGRREMCERLLGTFEKTASFADILFVIDGDDEDTYEGMDWKCAEHTVLSPRESLSGKLNRTADIFCSLYDALMFVGDDHVFLTEDWDMIMMDELKKMGGTGYVYPEDRRRSDVPEIVLISSDIIRTLGFFAEPSLKHYYLDNSWGELGSRSGLIRRCPQAVIPHLHYQVSDTPRDAVYQETEATWGQSDQAAWGEWRSTRMPVLVSLLRRTFNPDARWVTSAV